MHLTKALWALGVLSLAACASGGSGVVPGATDGTPRYAQLARALPATSPSPGPTTTPAGPSAGPAACAGGDGKHKCHTEKNPAFAPNPNPNPATVAGLTPADLRGAYGLPAVSASAVTATSPVIAVIDAFDDPTAESDLAVYRSRFNLPACTSANGCFFKLNQQGKAGKYPPFNGGWATEISLDLAMASAACPTCRIALVEADSDDINNLSAIVDQAALLRPAAISNSYGTLETADVVKQNDAHYNHPGVPITASAGDSKTVEFPASSKYVVAVTGSTLLRNAATARGWTEKAWNYSGSGCSMVEAAPSWQQGRSQCTTRAVGDVAFVADVSTGVAVFNSNDGGWEVLGGTSAGAPFVAGLYAAAANYGTSSGAQMLYANASKLNPVTSAATSGFTALGSPNGFAGI